MPVFKSIWRYAILAGAFHIILTTTIFLIGHFRVWPNTFNENGIGISFAIDGKTYQQLASDLAIEWRTNGFVAWMNAKAPLHSRLYSLSFVIFGRLLGHNILGAEPLNVFYYLAILSCIYLLGRELFDVETGFLAAVIVGLWPSFLLHSTQPIRDQISILCLLALLLTLVILLSRQFGWRKALTVGVAGGLLVTLFWLVRGNMWNVIVVAVAITLAMLVVRMIRAKTFMKGNFFAMLLIIAALVFVPSRFESTSLPGVRSPSTPLAIPPASQTTTRDSIWSTTIKEIAGRRAGFRSYTSQASNIDADVQLKSAADIVKYLPRAFEIGFFAPFPRMWVEAGSFGRATRLLSGLETLVMYFLYLAVGLCVWRERRNVKMWFVLLVAGIGMLALGLVVVNAGALFRIRYVFWMMMIVLAARGLQDRINKIFKINKIGIV